MKDQFAMFAAYNAWANEQVYGAAAALTPEELHADKGAFFGSILKTLNHLLVADRVWLYRFTGQGTMPSGLNAVLYEDFEELRAARRAEDRRIAEFVADLDENQLNAEIAYSPISNPGRVTQRLESALYHMFNHHTHHRGQCHATLTALGKPSLALDLVYFLRQQGQHWL